MVLLVPLPLLDTTEAAAVRYASRMGGRYPSDVGRVRKGSGARRLEDSGGGTLGGGLPKRAVAPELPAYGGEPLASDSGFQTSPSRVIHAQLARGRASLTVSDGQSPCDCMPNLLVGCNYNRLLALDDDGQLTF